MVTKKLADQASVSPATEFHSLEAIHRVEFSCEYLGKSLYTRAARPNQRPIYIKQNQPNHPAKLDIQRLGGNVRPE